MENIYKHQIHGTPSQEKIGSRERWEGSSQGTCIKDSWTWTIGRGLSVGVGVVGQGKAMEEKVGQL